MAKKKEVKKEIVISESIEECEIEITSDHKGLKKGDIHIVSRNVADILASKGLAKMKK